MCPGKKTKRPTPWPTLPLKTEYPRPGIASIGRHPAYAHGNSRFGRIRHAPLVLGVTLLLLLAPIFFQRWKLSFTPPGARSGDEPHYLVLLNSIIRDGDLRVDNNYQSSEVQRGIYLSELLIDHHSLLVDREQRLSVRWDQIYRYQVGKDQFTVRPDNPLHFDPARLNQSIEVGWHPPGYPMLLAPWLYYFIRYDFYYYETIIVLLQMLLYAAALLYLARSYRISIPLTVLIGTALPSYYYNAAFYTEGVASSLLIFWIALYHRRRYLMLSIVSSLLFFIKESYGPILIILAALIAFEPWLQQPGRSVAMPGLATVWNPSHFRPTPDCKPLHCDVLIIPPMVVMAIFVLKSYLIYGEAFRTYLPWEWNPEIVHALFALITGSSTGLLAFSPIILPVGREVIRDLFRSDSEAYAVVAILIYQYLLASFSIHWAGGPTFAYRLLVPVIALFTPWIVNQLTSRKKTGSRGLYFIWWLLLAISWINTFYGICNLNSAYNALPFINLIHPGDSLLIEKWFDANLFSTYL